MFITNQLFNNNISLNPSDLNKNIDNIILLKLKKIYEGYCKDNCFILNNSINIIYSTIGKIDTYVQNNASQKPSHKIIKETGHNFGRFVFSVRN